MLVIQETYKMTWRLTDRTQTATGREDMETGSGDILETNAKGKSDLGLYGCLQTAMWPTQ